MPRHSITTIAAPLVTEATIQETTCTVEEIPHEHKETTLAEWADIYLKLGKIRLTNLVVFTAFVPYYMCGGAMMSIALPSLFLGTYLQAMAANGLNQIIEREVDALMPRTRKRPLVIGAITVPHALCAVSVAAVMGCLVLSLGTNSLTCKLGMLSLLTYVCAYTPLKRVHWINTWVGTIPGALPPLMGAAAATGTLGTTAIFCGGVLALWQIPHFLSLSYLCKNEYQAAGFQMLPCVDAQKAADLAFSHTVALSAWCLFVPVFINCQFYFIVEAAILNLVFLYCANEYKLKPGTTTARSMFRYSIIYLAVLLCLLMLHRKLPKSKDTVANFKEASASLAAPVAMPTAPTPAAIADMKAEEAPPPPAKPQVTWTTHY